MLQWAKTLFSDALAFALLYIAAQGNPLAQAALFAIVWIALMSDAILLMVATVVQGDGNPKPAHVQEAINKLRGVLRSHSGKHYGYYDVATDVIFIACLWLMQWYVSAVVYAIASYCKRSAINLERERMAA